MMSVRVGRVASILSVSAAVLIVCSVPAVAAAEGAPTLTPGSPYTVWAYGAERTVTIGGTGHSGWAYEGSATYGYSVILNQTNLTATTFELAANRTMGATISVGYCATTCKKSVAPTVSLSYHEWEATDEWANFTTDGTVYEHGVPVTAIALLNSHSTVAGSLFDTAKWPLRSALLAINVSASASVTFATPLGLLPDNLTGGAQWNDSSDFSASGEWALSYFYNYTGPLGGHLALGPQTITNTVAATGEVGVEGMAGPTTVSLGGSSYQNVSLGVQGPFTLREGFILVPTEIDLFGNGSTSTGAPSGNATGGSAAEMTSVYARPLVGGHLGVGGSEWVFLSTASNPQVATLTPTSSGEDQLGSVDPAATGADQVGSTPVQGVPLAVGSAKGLQDCLVTGSGCPSTHGPQPLGGFLGVVVVGIVVAAVLASVAVVAQRRRIPASPNPNLGLYPPVVRMPGSGIAPGSSGSNPPPPPPPEDDPLAHLW
jgi:hypothetical protein